MSFLRHLRHRSVLLRSTPCQIPPIAVRIRRASGYGDPSDNAHPATSNPQDQGNSTQEKQAEHPGPRADEPDTQGGSSFGDKGQNTKADAAPTDTKSASRAAETSWDGNHGGSRGGSKVHGKDRTETKLGGNLSGNKDKTTDENTTAGVSRVKGDLNVMGQTDGKDARDVGGKDDSRKQS
jgi:hypothetical protein